MNANKQASIIFITLVFVGACKQSIIPSALLAYCMVFVFCKLFGNLNIDTDYLYSLWLSLEDKDEEEEDDNPNGFRAFADRFETLEDVNVGLRDSGVESIEMIVAVDFTKSNQTNGTKTFGGLSLHDVSGRVTNPYLDAINTLACTLKDHIDTGFIEGIGFGDINCKADRVFDLNQPNRFATRSAIKIEHLSKTYANVASKVRMSGPTSFSPAFDYAIQRCKDRPNQFFLLVIVTDGETLFPKDDAKKLCELSKYPVSVICIGVGDGGVQGKAWKLMEEFDDGIKERDFDNFQFVNFNDFSNHPNKQVEFAKAALMEVPDQYMAMKSRRMFNRPKKVSTAKR